MKITKKERKKNRQLTIQRHRAQKIEDYLINYVDPVECPVVHHFTDNEQTELNTYCREFFIPAGVVLTGLIYKLEVFWVLVTGSLRMLEGDHVKDVYAPCLLRNVVGTKNGIYAYEDCLIYGFIPNTKNSRDLEEVINIFSATPAKEVQGMSANKQQLSYEKRLLNETV